MKRPLFGLFSLIIVSSSVYSCGRTEAESRLSKSDSNGDTVAADGTGVSLKRTSDESVVESVVFGLSQKQSTSLSTTSEWTVELEQRKDVTSNVPAQKYLRVSGNLQAGTSQGSSEIGCLQIELRDNVNYREQGWLRIATNGIKGNLYNEVSAPIFIDQNGWSKLPVLNDSITLGKFAVNTVKKFDGTVCFKIDTKDLPAQDYNGQVIVQYLKTGVPHQEPAIDLAQFSCSQEPIAINAGALTNVTFRYPENIGQLTYAVRSNPSLADAGSVSLDPLSPNRLIYKAPANPAKTFLALIEAKPSNTKYLPVFCEVHVIARSDFGVGDDGEIQGLTGNVYKIPDGSPKIPDFSKMNPISQIVMSNIDIPERAFTAGFPGVKDVIEWFGVQVRGTLRVPTDCNNCKFKLVSDDGANFYIGDTLVVNNDGTHSTQAREGTKALNAGDHQIRVDYYQGPRYHITLQLFWDLGDGKGYQVIPATAFARPMK